MASKSLIDMIMWEIYKEEAKTNTKKNNKKWKEMIKRYEKEKSN